VNEPVYPSTVAEFSERLLEQLPRGATGRLTYRGEVKQVLLIAFPGGGSFRVTVEDAEAARAADDRGRLRKRRPTP
jgi:hypothetical protein